MVLHSVDCCQLFPGTETKVSGRMGACIQGVRVCAHVPERENSVKEVDSRQTGLEGPFEFINILKFWSASLK